MIMSSRRALSAGFVSWIVIRSLEIRPSLIAIASSSALCCQLLWVLIILPSCPSSHVSSG